MYRIFLFPRKSSFFRIFEEFRMNEWKSCFFFFRFVFFFPPKKSNEWMTLELFRGKEKKQKNTQKFGKKKYKQLLLKKKETSSKSDWMTDELFLGKKKKTAVFFFSRFAGKIKNTRFSDLNEWMTNVHVREKKIRYLWVDHTGNSVAIRNIEACIQVNSSPKIIKMDA